jgi:hypothetical protein
MGKKSNPFAHARRLGVALVTLVFVLLAFELGARLAFPAPRYVQSLPYDPELGFRAPANVHMENSDPGGGFPYDLNQLGFRGPELPTESKHAGTERLLFCGDSFLMGWQVRKEALVPFSTESVLRESGRHVESYSLACNGYGTAQQWILLRKYAGPSDPDYVVLCFFTGNDVADNSRDLVGRTHVSSGGYLRPFLLRDDSGDLRTTWLQPARAALRAGSRVFQLVEHRLLRMAWIDSQARREGALLSPEDRLAAGRLPLPYLEMFTTQEDEHWEAAWDATAVALEAIRDEVRRLGARLIVAILPHKYQVQRDASSIGMDTMLRRSKSPPLNDRLDWNLPERRLQELLRGLEIETVSLLEPLRRETAEERVSMFRREGHWNGRGHALAGREIARAIQALEKGETRAPGGTNGQPVDLPTLVFEKQSEIDLQVEIRPELMGFGWHGWRSDWWGETYGWVMREKGEILVPNRTGELILKCWLPSFAELPAVVRLNGEEHVIERTGEFSVWQDIQATGEGEYRFVRVETTRSFPFMRGKRAGLVLQGFAVRAPGG